MKLNCSSIPIFNLAPVRGCSIISSLACCRRSRGSTGPKTCAKPRSHLALPVLTLRQLVEEIGPAVLIPIHSEHPELFADWSPKLLVPEKGRPILLG